MQNQSVFCLYNTCRVGNSSIMPNLNLKVIYPTDLKFITAILGSNPEIQTLGSEYD